MDYVDVQGESVAKVGLGTWQLTGDECRAVVERGLDLGYRHIDTAQAYQNEAMVGAAIEMSGIDREDIFLTTKLGLDNLHRDAVIRTAHDSRRRLAVDYIDLLMIHWPSQEVPLSETLEAMMRLQEEGTIRYIGLSNFTPSLVEEAMSIAPIMAVQVEYHPFLAQHRLAAICRQRELMLTAYSPLARGKVAKDRMLRAIGESYGKSATQVALRWLIQQHNVSVIPKASTEEHLRENIDIFDFELNREEQRLVSELERGERLIDPDFAPQWGR